MLSLLRPKRATIETRPEAAEPHPALALAVGLVYVFRTTAGARILRELETAVRKYAADPAALWKLVHSPDADHDVIDTTAETIVTLPPTVKPKPER